MADGVFLAALPSATVHLLKSSQVTRSHSKRAWRSRDKSCQLVAFSGGDQCVECRERTGRECHWRPGHSYRGLRFPQNDVTMWPITNTHYVLYPHPIAGCCGESFSSESVYLAAGDRYPASSWPQYWQKWIPERALLLSSQSGCWNVQLDFQVRLEDFGLGKVSVKDNGVGVASSLVLFFLCPCWVRGCV